MTSEERSQPGLYNRRQGSPGRMEVQRPGGPANLADILERVLDKGIVIAGDIQINLLDIELLTIKLRLLVASVDKAKEMGIDWWESDPSLTRSAREEADENRRLRERVDALERQLSRPESRDGVDDRPVELVAEGALAALASTVPAERYGDSALRERLEDMYALERL